MAPKSLLNNVHQYSRNEYSRKSHRIKETLLVRQNDKGIPKNTSIKALYRNPQRNDPINQDVQWGFYLYDFALLNKYNTFRYSKWLFYFG